MTNDSRDKNVLTETETSRREFVKAAGKLAIYTTPAVMLLMRPATNSIAASTGLPENSDFSQAQGGSNSQERRHQRFWLWRLFFGD